MQKKVWLKKCLSVKVVCERMKNICLTKGNYQRLLFFIHCPKLGGGEQIPTCWGTFSPLMFEHYSRGGCSFLIEFGHFKRKEGGDQSSKVFLILFGHKQRMHAEKKTEKCDKCDECDGMFITALFLRRHIWGVHREIRNKMCPFCGQAYYNKDLCHTHENNIQWKCEYCDKSF